MKALFLAALLLSAPAVQERTLLRDVRVVDLEAGRIVPGQSILIEGARIAKVAPVGELAAPAGAALVEGGGRYALPGLFDMHVHLSAAHGETTLLLLAANGVTCAQSMHGSRLHLAFRARVQRGELIGPRLFTTGPTTAQVGVHSVEQAERVVREQKAAGYDAIKMYGDGSNTMPRATYHQLVTTAHELGLRVVGHAPRNMGFSAVLEEHQDSIDHMEEIVYTDEGLARLLGPYVRLQFGGGFDAHPELLGEVPDFRTGLKDEVRALAGKVAAAGLRVTPTLVTFATIQQTTDDAFFELVKRPELAYFPVTVTAEWTPEKARFRNGGWQPHLDFMARYLQRNVELQAELVRAFHEAGVPLMTGTDAPFDFVVPGFSLHDELARFVACGLTPLEALRSATLVPAETLGIAGEAGTIAAGKSADLVLLEADPLADVNAVRRNAGVFLRGRWLAPEVLRSELDGLLARNAALAQSVPALTALLDGGKPVEAAAAMKKEASDPRLSAWLERELHDRGYEALRASRLDEALLFLRTGTETFPDSADAWDSLGEVCLERAEYEQALAHYERALELDPDSANAQRMIDRCVDELAAAR